MEKEIKDKLLLGIFLIDGDDDLETATSIDISSKEEYAKFISALIKTALDSEMFADALSAAIIGLDRVKNDINEKQLTNS